MNKTIKYHLITYGCQMNVSDSERIATILGLLNYQSVNNYHLANLIIINMCSVRQSAVDRVYGKIRQIKKDNPKAKIMLTGCILKTDQQKLIKQVDLVFNIKELPQLPQMLNKFWHPTEKNNLPKSYLEIIPRHQNKFSAYVPIMTGCNNFCSYCVVPHTRGQEISRPTNRILSEIKKLINSGYKEIILLGQNVNSYHGKIAEKEINFAQLLQLINNLTSNALPTLDERVNNFWIRFLTSHPKDLSDQLITTISQGEKITKYIHLPAQSGSNKILKKMNRGYTVNYYLDLIKKIRQLIPDIALSTDIIVGFPGETKSDFQQTAKLLRRVKFDMVYIARYSPRAGTASAKMKDNVSLLEKKGREKELTEILQTTALFNNQKYLHKKITVLIDEKKYGNLSGKIINNKWFGRTSTFKKVMIKLAPDHRPTLQIGQWQLVKITQVTPWGLTGVAIF